MIAKVTSRSGEIAGLVRYLFGPGKTNEHTDQHVVAGSRLDAAVSMQPGQADGRFDTRGLVDKLDQWNAAYGADAQVWHCSVSLPAVDGQLSDGQWREVAERLVDAVGLGDCEWVAVRHGVSVNGNDHIHIAARKIDGYGRKVPTAHDARVVRQVCREFEDQWGLTATKAADGTANTAASRAEIERAAREGRAVPVRVQLAGQVRVAAALSNDLDDLRTLLGKQGVVVGQRVDDSGTVVGVTFGDPTYVDAAGQPVMFGGTKLGKDLGLGGLQHRWAVAAAVPDAQAAVAAMQHAAEQIAAGAPGALRGMWEAADQLHVAARILEPGRPDGPLHQAAAAGAAAARPGYIAVPPAVNWTAGMRLGMLGIWSGAGANANTRQRRELQMMLAAYRLMHATTQHLSATGNLRRAKLAGHAAETFARAHNTLLDKPDPELTPTAPNTIAMDPNYGQPPAHHTTHTQQQSQPRQGRSW